MSLNIRQLALVIAAASSLGACGGGGTSSNATPTPLFGTAAVGTPIVGGIVSVRCANGMTATSQPSSAAGLWQVTLTDPVFPCAAELNGGTVNNVPNTLQLHSIALNGGTLNVTQLTDLMVAVVTHTANPNTWFSGLQSSSLTALDAVALNAALNVLVNVLNMGQLGSTTNPMTTSFTPISGNVIDDSLTSLGAALNSLGLSYSTLLSQVSAQSPISSSGLALAILSQYANTVSGANGKVGLTNAPTGTNSTTGQTANGSPQIAISNCSVSAGGASYAQCQPNAIANFGPVSVKDATTGQTCTANYANGTLTVSDGGVSITGFLNGSFLSDLSVFGSGDAVTAQQVSGYSAAGTNIGSSSVNWTVAGAFKSINGKSINLLGATTEFNCTN